MTGSRAPLCLAAGVLAAVHCGKGATPSLSAAAENATAPVGGPGSASGDAALEPMDPREAEAWAHAREGDDEDRMRLADRLGCTGLRERADDAALRSTAVRSMSYCGDFSQLPWLVGIATAAGEAAGLEALDAVVEQAARPRRSRDPEDAAELGEGCRMLLALARAKDATRPRRVMAVRALRMLTDVGCVKPSEIPAEFDAK